MKAAETLGKRGHDVVLLEKGDHLGGQLRLVVKTPGRHMWNVVARDLKVQMELGGVDVRLSRFTGSGLVPADYDRTLVFVGVSYVESNARDERTLIPFGDMPL